MPRGCLLFVWGNIPVWGHQCRRIYDSWWYWQRKTTGKHKKPCRFPINYLKMSIWRCITYQIILSHFEFHYVTIAILPKSIAWSQAPEFTANISDVISACVWVLGHGELQYLPRAADDQTSVTARRKAWSNYLRLISSLTLAHQPHETWM